MEYEMIGADNFGGRGRARRKKRIAKRISKKQAKGKTKSIKRLTKKRGRVIDRDIRADARKELTRKERAKAAVLLPFKPMIAGMLKLRGYNTRQMPFATQVSTFYKDVVKGDKKDWDVGVPINTDNFDMQDEDFILNHVDDNADNVVGAAAGTFTMIVKAVLTFVKKLKADKEAGVELPPQEAKIAAFAQKVDGDLAAKKAKEDAVKVVAAAKTPTDKKMSTTQMAGLGIGVLVIGGLLMAGADGKK